jgi:hypothetical protein
MTAFSIYLQLPSISGQSMLNNPEIFQLPWNVDVHHINKQQDPTCNGGPGVPCRGQAIPVCSFLSPKPMKPVTWNSNFSNGITSSQPKENKNYIHITHF